VADEPKHYFDEVERLVDEELRKVAEKRIARRKKRGWFSISNAGWCMRATILNRLNAKENPKTEKELRTFFIGDLIHEGYRNLIEKAGQLVASEQFVSSGYGPDASDRVGVFDIIVRKKSNGVNVLYEMKSIGAGGFWKIVLKLKEPHFHHKAQAVTYYLENKKYRIDEVKVIYFSKQDGAIRAYPVKLTDELIKEVEAWWDTVRAYYVDRHLPAPFEKDSVEYKEYYCVNCSFAPHYCFPPEGQEEQVKQNLLELSWDSDLLTENLPPPTPVDVNTVQ